MRIAGCLLALWSSCLFFLPSPGHAEPVSTQLAPHHINILEGLVVGVNEGDRLTVNSFGTEIPVRLYGVAAPQTAKIDKFTGWFKPGQPYAEDAFRALSIKVLHQKVKVEVRNTLVAKGGPPQVAVAVIYLGDRNINLEMLNDGWAWTYKKLLNRADYHRYSTVERLARNKRTGLWLQENPQPPWEFRPSVRTKAKQHN